MSDLVKRARHYIANNAAESGADVLITELADRIEVLEAALRKAQEVLAELNTSIDNFWNDRRRPRLGNTCISSVNRVAVAQISSRAALAEIEKVLK